MSTIVPAFSDADLHSDASHQICNIGTRENVGIKNYFHGGFPTRMPERANGSRAPRTADDCVLAAFCDDGV